MARVCYGTLGFATCEHDTTYPILKQFNKNVKGRHNMTIKALTTRSDKYLPQPILYSLGMKL